MFLFSLSPFPIWSFPKKKKKPPLRFRLNLTFISQKKTIPFRFSSLLPFNYQSNLNTHSLTHTHTHTHTVGPSLEAFGYQRVIYGSSPSPSSPTRSNAGDWYELARESFAELGIEQEGIDAVFYGNAQRVYGLSSSSSSS